jgi:hypothetical protein
MRRRQFVSVGSIVSREKGGGRASTSDVNGTTMTIGYGSKWFD